MSAITVDAGRSADDERQRAGGIGGFRRCSKKEQRRESDDGATSGHGIDSPSGGGGEDQADDFGRLHLRAERKHPAHQLELRLAQRSFAAVERGLVWRSAADGRMTSWEISE